MRSEIDDDRYEGTVPRKMTADLREILDSSR
jgi:hypothetical protein